MTTTADPIQQGSRRPRGGHSPFLIVGALLAVLGIVWAAVNFSGLLLRQTATESASFAGVSRLVVDLPEGDIRLDGSEGTDVVYQAELVWSYDRPRVHASQNGDVLELSANCDLALVGWCDSDFEIAVPAGIVVEARTSSGDIQAIGLHERATLHSSSGDVQAEEMAGPLDLSTSSGDVDAVNVSGDAAMRTSSGDVDGVSLGGDRVEARTGSGDVTLDFTESPREVSAQTSSGDATVKVPDESGIEYRVEVESDSGDDTNDVASDPNAARTITARTNSGDARVLYR